MINRLLISPLSLSFSLGLERASLPFVIDARAKIESVLTSDLLNDVLQLIMSPVDDVATRSAIPILEIPRFIFV